jgi:hypothetical protein
MRKINPIFRFLILFFLALTSSVQLTGADFFKERENALTPGRWQLGPFQIFPQFTVENVGYTDNIYGYTETPQPGWMADLGMRVKAAAVIGRRTVFVFEGHPYYSYFSAVDSERALNAELGAKVYSWLAGIHLMYGFQYGDTRSHPNREFAARVRRYSNIHNLEAEFGKQGGVFFTLFARTFRMDFADEGFMERYAPGTRLNRSERDWGLRVNLPVFTATLLVFQARLSQYRFDNFTERDGKALTVSGGIHFPEIGHLTGNAEVGYKRYFPDASDFAEFNTLYGSGRVSYRFMRRWRLRLEYGVDNHFSFIDTQFYFNERSVQTGLDFYLTEKIRMGGSYRSGRHAYHRIQDNALQFVEDYSQFEVQVAFRLRGTTGIGLSFQRQWWDSQRNDLQRGQYFIGGFLTHDF